MKKRNVTIRTLAYIIPYWYLILASTLAGVAKLTLPLILPQVVKHFTDDILPVASGMSDAAKVNEILKWLVILLFIYTVLYIPSAFIRQAGSIEVANRVMNKMRCQLFEHMQKMSASFHNEFQSGGLVTRINSDVEQVHTFIWAVATNVWIDGIVMLVYIVLLLQISIPLTIIACITLPLSVFATRHIRGKINRNSYKVRAGLSDISGYMQERMSGFAVVKLFGMADYENKKFDKYSNDIYRYNRKANRLFSVGESMTSSFSENISAIILCLAAIQIVYGKMTIGEMIVFNSYLAYFTTPIRRFAELSVTYSKSVSGIQRVYEILDMEPDIKDKVDAVPLTNQIPMKVVFDHVSFRYDLDSTERILNDISFTVNQGEKVALVGSSGCGKSTIINLLARFYETSSGEIFIGDRSLYDYTLESIYEQMGIVFQETTLFSGTIEENIRYGKKDATGQELVEAAKAANAWEFIEKCPEGWNTMLGERGIGLSGGQKQRISIARVFLKNPRLLILDEATSALDSESEKLVQEALDGLMQNRTTIVIAHRLSTVINSDKIIVMDKGEIVETGSHEELLAKGGRYQELYMMQFKDVI